MQSLRGNPSALDRKVTHDLTRDPGDEGGLAVIASLVGSGEPDVFSLGTDPVESRQKFSATRGKHNGRYEPDRRNERKTA